MDDPNMGVFVAKMRFTRPEDAERAIDALDGQRVKDRVVRVFWVQRSRPKGQMEYMHYTLSTRDA